MTARATAPSAVQRFHEICLLGMLASGYFALAGSLDWPTAALMAAALIWRGMTLARAVRMEFSPSHATAMAFLCLVFYPLDIWFVSQSYLTATVHLVCFLAVMKILTATTARDFAWVRVIALMELLAASLVSASPAFFVFLALFLLFAVAAFSSGEVARSVSAAAEAPRSSLARGTLRMAPRRLAVFSSALFVGVLAMTAMLFFVLPRTARAAFERFAPQRYHLPGFVTEVALGEIGQIKRRNTPAMHVRSYKEGPLPVLRWRGAALAHFDGRRWYNTPGEEELVRVEGGLVTLGGGAAPTGRDLSYMVQLSEISADTLLFAGKPLSMRINVPRLWRTPEGALRVRRPSVAGLRYQVYAIPEDEASLAAPSPLPEAARREMLLLPRQTDRRIYRLARDLTAGAATQEEIARGMERRLQHDYGYTLELPASPPQDPLAYFLFDRRKGHCEYFASAMAVLLRAVGIPSRVATGFLGGVHNPMTGWQVVRASDAHSWVEAWIDGRGWMTFDPTPPDPNAASEGLGQRLALLSDAIAQFWQDWVLSYDLERQVALASRLEQSRKSLRLDWFDGLGVGFARAAEAASGRVGWIVVFAVAGIAILKYRKPAGAWVGRWRGRRRAQRGEALASDATLLYGRMLDVLERRGFRKPPWVTPAEFATMLPASPMSTLVEHMTWAYNECRFGGRREAAPRMVELLELIERG
jgi:transglutaminase-like putative cysteine protease